MNFDYEPTHRSISDGSDVMVTNDYFCPDGWAWAYNENGDIFPIELFEWAAVGESHANPTPCKMCGGDIFIATWEDEVIWSHFEEGCDDPTP